MRALALILLCLAVAVPAIAEPTNAEPIVVDGTLTEAEWGPEATKVPLEGQVLTAREGDILFIGLRSPSTGLVNINLRRGDEIRVLHQSGSLGRAVYTHADDTWTRVEDYEWRLRHMGKRTPRQDAVAARLRAKLGKDPVPAEERIEDPQEIRAKIDGHLVEHGWTAAPGPVASASSAELALDLAALGEGWEIAVQWMTLRKDGDAFQKVLHSWPAGSIIAPEDPAQALLSGNAPDTVDFTLEGWKPLADVAP